MSRVRLTLLVSLICGVVALWAAFAPGNSRTAHAVCADDSQDPSNLFTVSPPVENLALGGVAPLLVTVTMVDTTLLTGPMTMSFSWGDGASSPVNIVACGDDLYNVTAQQLSHTYTSPGAYVMQWHLNSQIAGQFSSLAVIVTVTGAQATATPEPATPTPVPAAATSTQQPTGTPVGATAVPAATETIAPGETRSPTVTPTATVTRTPATATPTSTPTLGPVVVSGVITPTPTPRMPQVFLDVPDPEDVSTDAGVVSTNLVLAGITVWVFFSSVLFNQTMQEHRDEVSGWTKKLRPRVKMPRVSAASLATNSYVIWALVLGGTGVIYGLLEPGFGFNRASFVVFASVVIGVGIVGTFYSSLEAWSRRRRLSVQAAVRAYPFSLVVAAVCVATSRLLNLHPGVIYGFAASCVVIDASSRNEDPEGRALIVPLTACLGLSVVFWLMLGVLRSFPGALLSDILEGVAIIVFVGGLEGLFVNLIPLQVMDGAKIYRWNRRTWVALVLVTAFLVWHVLLNSQGAYFESLRKASSLSVLIAFLVYTSAGVGLWGYFELRKRRQRPVTVAGA